MLIICCCTFTCAAGALQPVQLAASLHRAQVAEAVAARVEDSQAVDAPVAVALQDAPAADALDDASADALAADAPAADASEAAHLDVLAVAHGVGSRAAAVLPEDAGRRLE